MNSEVDGPHKSLASDIHKQLRSNLISNVYKQYKENGYIFEQYNDDGKGQGCYPFTGWSALVPLIMAEL